MDNQTPRPRDKSPWATSTPGLSPEEVTKRINQKMVDSFGDDYPTIWAGAVAIARPKGASIFDWIEKLESARALPTYLERRTALYELIVEYAEKLENQEARENVAKKLERVNLNREINEDKFDYEYRSTNEKREEQYKWWNN
jgi:hypothetical protein